MFCPFCGAPLGDRVYTSCPRCEGRLPTDLPTVPAQGMTFSPTQHSPAPDYRWPSPTAHGFPAQMEGGSRPSTQRLWLVLGVLGAILLAATGGYFASAYRHSPGSTQNGVPVVAASTTPSAPPTNATVATTVPTDATAPTATPKGADCRALAGFGLGSPASSVAAGNGYAPPTTPLVPFPAYSPGFLYSSFTDLAPGNPQDVYHFILISVCSPETTVGAVSAFYASAMPQDGWSQSPNFPYAGDFTRRCGDPYCWNWGPTGGDINRYASLEAVQQVGSAVTFSLRLGTEQYV